MNLGSSIDVASAKGYKPLCCLFYMIFFLLFFFFPFFGYDAHVVQCVCVGGVHVSELIYGPEMNV